MQCSEGLVNLHSIATSELKDFNRMFTRLKMLTAAETLSDSGSNQGLECRPFSGGRGEFSSLHVQIKHLAVEDSSNLKAGGGRLSDESINKPLLSEEGTTRNVLRTLT